MIINDCYIGDDQLPQVGVEAHDHHDCCIADDQLPQVGVSKLMIILTATLGL